MRWPYSYQRITTIEKRMMLEKRMMWKWFVRGEATSHFPSLVVVAGTEEGFSHAVALAPRPTPDGVEDFQIFEDEESLWAVYSEQPMIQPINYYTRARQRMVEADDRRGLLASQQEAGVNRV